MERRRNILEFAGYLRKHPWQPIKLLARGFECDPHQIQKWLPELEVKIKLGDDPENGRKNVQLFAIVLPRAKAAALTQKGNSQ